MAVEFELKFSATDAVLSVLREKTEGTEKHFDMRTTYYDTKAGDLSARHWTLRLRKENDASVCTLKVPAENSARAETEVLCDNIEAAIPMLCKQSGLDELAHLTKEGVVPVCGAAFHRVAKTFMFEGTKIELALDQGILMGGGRKIPLCEVELELKEGDPTLLRTYATVLAATYGLTPEKHSKFRRALDLAKGE